MEGEWLDVFLESFSETVKKYNQAFFHHVITTIFICHKLLMEMPPIRHYIRFNLHKKSLILVVAYFRGDNQYC